MRIVKNFWNKLSELQTQLLELQGEEPLILPQRRRASGCLGDRGLDWRSGWANGQRRSPNRFEFGRSHE